MALSNYDRVGKTMEILKKGLAPFVEREVYARLSAKDAEEMIADFADADRKLAGKSIDRWDVAALLNFMWIKWNEIYSRTLGKRGAQSTERTPREPEQVGASGYFHD